MKLLLDTHALLWIAEGNPRVPHRIRNLIESSDQVHVSAATAWEIGTKVRLGRLAGAERWAADFALELKRDAYIPLHITVEHATFAGSMADEHQDPFDRMLAAQSILEDMVLISADEAMDAFNVMRSW